MRCQDCPHLYGRRRMLPQVPRPRSALAPLSGRRAAHQSPAWRPPLRPGHHGTRHGPGTGCGQSPDAPADRRGAVRKRRRMGEGGSQEGGGRGVRWPWLRSRIPGTNLDPAKHGIPCRRSHPSSALGSRCHRSSYRAEARVRPSSYCAEAEVLSSSWSVVEVVSLSGFGAGSQRVGCRPEPVRHRKQQHVEGGDPGRPVGVRPGE